MEEEQDNFLRRLGVYFLIILVISSFFEIGLLIYAYINADKVECNFLWCTFTSGEVITIKDNSFNYSSTSRCSINNIEVNCSELDSYKNKFDYLIP